MKHITQTLACLSFIFALQAPCNARHSAKRTRTILYSIVGGVIVIAAAALGSSSLYASRSRKLRRTPLEDPSPLPQDRDGTGLLTPRKPDSGTSDSEVDTVSTDDTRLSLSPDTPKTPCSRRIVNNSALTPEQLRTFAPYFTPYQERMARSRRISATNAAAAQARGDIFCVDGGVLIPGSYRNNGMPVVRIGLTPDKRRKHPRTRVVVTPDAQQRLLEEQGSDSN